MLQTRMSRVRIQIKSLNFFIILLASLVPEVYSASIRNEYQKQKKIGSG
jgi:hypothetical protein